MPVLRKTAIPDLQTPHPHSAKVLRQPSAAECRLQDRSGYSDLSHFLFVFLHLFFLFSYFIIFCVAEVWGFKKARLIIWSGFAMNFFVVALGLIAVAIPAAPFWEGEEHFNFVFGMAPRIVAASLMAFLVGSFLNAYVMSKMKVASQGRNFSARAIWSTVVGETADSLIFFPVAFGGVIAWKELLIMMGIQIVLKSMYEVIILPVTIRVVKAIKKIDGSDVYDTDISYNVLKVKDI